ncbi:PAP2-domain-containing protein [Rhodocollybia butyracea]|uniref:PAP2-domain-containing protein n=1 Tax=Rhodocollybia butyracea TaxID=206335 RepID=A0A9P5PUW1_9AGAR|nr:PAP2-domain-containing protein [Rhodocollybia butyracea]
MWGFLDLAVSSLPTAIAMSYAMLPNNAEGANQSNRVQSFAPLPKNKLVRSYAPDWTIMIILAALFFSLDNVDGYQRLFSLDDTSLRHPYAVHERVPVFALYMLSIVAPLLLQCIINFFTIRSWWDFHNSTLGLFLSLALTGSITQFTKITVGRPRPDIIDRCQPPAGSADPIYGLSSASAICTQIDIHIMRDGFRSFPSGHSSLSFAGLGFLAFYLAGKLHLFDHKGHVGKAWISLAPFAGALLVAISRTMDYRHHWEDVVVGSLLGILMAYFSYRQYYPDLASKSCHRPYAPRIKRDTNILPSHFHRQPSTTSHHSAASALGGISHPPPGNYSDDPILELEGRPFEGTVARPEPESLREIWDRDDE